MQRIRLFEVIGAAIILALTAFAGISCVQVGSADKLEGVTWVLKSYGDPNDLISAVPDREVTLTFDKENKKVGGNGGINAYGGKYEIDGSKLKVQELYQTLMAGPEPLMSQEVEFFKILASATSFIIDGQELTITGNEGVLVFTQN
jgi:heat shock protein HslJ